MQKTIEEICKKLSNFFQHFQSAHGYFFSDSDPAEFFELRALKEGGHHWLVIDQEARDKARWSKGKGDGDDVSAADKVMAERRFSEILIFFGGNSKLSSKLCPTQRRVQAIEVYAII